MSDKTETLTVLVTEAVQYRHTFGVTPELLDEAEEEGYERSSAGVLKMIETDPDHDVVLAAVDDENFLHVFEREVEEA